MRVPSLFLRSFLLLPLLLPAAFAQGIITTLAGTSQIYPLDGLPPLSVSLAAGFAPAVARNGDLYYSNEFLHVVLKLSADGRVRVVAGNGVPGFSGDGGPATSASLNYPQGIALDPAGNLYITEAFNSRIRKVSTNGIITTFAGNGVAGDSGDNGPATSASFSQPINLAVDGNSNVYVTDFKTNRVRRISAGGVVTAFAGAGPAGYTGDGGPATAATLRNPLGLAVDGANNVYIADFANNVVRRVDSNGRITTVAGTGQGGYSGDGGPAIRAQLGGPAGVVVDRNGVLYIADLGNHRVRRVDTNGTITTIAGTGVSGFSGDGGPATRAQLSLPKDLAFDLNGNLIIADRGNTRMRRIDGNGNITTIIGNGGANFFGDNGVAPSAGISNPHGIALDPSGSLYITDLGNLRVRRIGPEGVITTFAGNGGFGSAGDGGPAAAAALAGPVGVASDAAGNVYIADSGNHSIRKVDTKGTITTIAGSGKAGLEGDGGAATSAKLSTPSGVAADTSGNVYIADTGNNRIRRVSPNGVITSVVSSGLSGPTGLAIDAQNNLFIADTANNAIKRLNTSTGAVTTVAGGRFGTDGDNGPATSAGLAFPEAVAVDNAGNLYIADSGAHRVRRVGVSGIISTIAGGGQAGYCGDGGLATSACLLNPKGVAVDARGNVYISDTGNNRIRQVLVTAPVLNVSPGSLEVTVSQGATPEAVPIAISSNVTGMPFTASAQSDRDWMSLSLTSGSTPASLQVLFNTAGLAQGTYTGSINVNAPLANPGARTIPVRLTVTAARPAQLTADTKSLSFNALQGGAAITQQLVARNLGGTLTYRASVSGASWLSVSPGSGSLTASDRATINVTADPRGLNPGTYTANVVLESSETGQRISVPVTLTVQSATRRLLLSQTGLTFTAVSGGGSPLPQTVGVLNVGQGSMSWQAEVRYLSNNGDWVSLSNNSGSVSTPYLDVSPFAVSVNPANLSPGQYYAQVRVTADADNSPQLLTVVLKVLPADSDPGPEVRPGTLVFTGAAGSTPGSQQVLIGNSSHSPISYQASHLTLDGGDWFVHVPQSATINPGQQAQMVVQPDFKSLSPGVHKGAVTLLFANGIRTVEVVAVVAPAGTVVSSKTDRQAAGCGAPNLVVTITQPVTGFASGVGQPTPVEARVVDGCGQPHVPLAGGAGAVVTAQLTNGETWPLNHRSNGVWSATWTPKAALGSVSLRLLATFAQGATTQTGTSTTVTGSVQPAGNPPVLSSGGVTNAATFQAFTPVAPGGLVSVFGSSLADPTSSADRLPLPVELNGTEVRINDRPLPLLYTSDGQVNAQVPYDLPTNTAQQIFVRRRGAATTAEAFNVAPAQPGIFTKDRSGRGQGIVFAADGITLAQTGSPVRAGDVIVIYATGLGAVNPAVATGTAAPSNPLSRTVLPVTVLIDGQPSPQVDFSGLTPGFSGLYQINAVVPASTRAGDAIPIQIRVSEQTSPEGVTFAVRR